jgi:hypothetical protein
MPIGTAPTFSLAAAVLAVSLAAETTAHAESVQVTGILTDEGVECPAIRGDDRELYTLIPKTMLQAFEVGDRLRVTGSVQEVSFCQQGTTIGMESVYPAD